MAKRLAILPFAIASALLAAALAGFLIQGSPGLLLYPLALVITPVGLFIGWHMLDLILTYERHTTRISQIRARVSRLPTNQLQALAATPAHPDFGFAITTLARRGVETKPSKAALLELLLFPDPNTRGRAMSFLFAFYPDLRLPKGSSSQDPPEVWRDRLSALTARDQPDRTVNRLRIRIPRLPNGSRTPLAASPLPRQMFPAPT